MAPGVVDVVIEEVGVAVERIEQKIERVSATKEKGECNKVFDTRISATKYSKLG